MNRLFRNPKPSNKSSGLKSPGTAVSDAARSIAAGGLIGANNSSDLSSKIDPYTFGTNITPSSSPSPYSTNTSSTTNTTNNNNNSSTNSSAAISPLSHIHTGLPIHAPLQTRAASISNHGHSHPQHTHATSAADGYTDPTLVPPPARRHSLRARSSSEEPWVVVSDSGNGMDSRSGSFASSFMSDTTPGGANTASGQITPNPSLYNSNSSGPYGSSAAGTPFDATNPSSPIQQQPQQPLQPQTQRGTGVPGGGSVVNIRPPAGPPQKSNGVYTDMQNTGGTVGPVPSGGAPRAPMESMENQGYQNANFNTLRDKDRESVHSQQDKPGSWARGIFGGNTTSARDKEANVELMRMIGFLVAAAPDDWNLVLEVCERASASESAAKEAARALRKEFSHGEPSAQLSAARLWAIMLQNANDNFILQTASRKFLENLEEVINSERTSPVVRERLLDVLASAAYTFGKKPGKEGYASTWKKVRPSWKPPEGVPFDPEDVLFGSAFPRRVPPGQVPVQQGAAGYYGSQPQPPQNYGIGRGDDREQGRDSTNTGTYGRGDREGNGRSGDRADREKDKHRRDRERDKLVLQQQRQLEALQQQAFRTYNTPQAPPRKDRGIIPPEEDIRRLFQECDVAKNNAQVLSGALPFATPSSLSTDKLIQEFYAKCRASQELIMAQIAWASAGAERSRLAAEKAAKDSGSDNDPNRLIRKPKPGQNNASRNNGGDDLTKEERLLAALLSASTELMEVFKEYEQLEQIARTEKEEREIAKRSMAETRMDRTQIHLIQPDGSVVEAPAAANAGSSSRSPSPSVPAATTRNPSGITVPTVASNAAAVKAAGGRDLPLPPFLSGEHLVTPGGTPITPNAPNYPPQQPPGTPASQQQQGQPYHGHQHHSSTHSINNYNTATLNLPPAAPHGPRHPPSSNRSRTPSPDRPIVSGTVSGTTSPPPMEYGPPSHPPPQHGQRGGSAAGVRYDSLGRGNRTESPVPGGAPPGLGGTHNVAGMRIDTEAAHRYSSGEEDIMTPIKPSAKALGKRRAEVEAPPDEEELERREEEELEEAFYRSTIPIDVETPTTRTVHYVYDAAAERAKELDRMEKEEREKERLKTLQARNSIQRGSGGGSGTAAAVAAAGGAGAQQQQPLGAVNTPRA